jgi:SAM-dependent methyltransferase
MEHKRLTCRFCGEPLEKTFTDLGTQPLCESYLMFNQINQKEPSYPLHVYFCTKCFLVQLEESITPQQMYKNYAYFSSSSKGWLKHCEEYANMIVDKLRLSSASHVLEIGSNDGYMLQYFIEKNVPVTGVEPAQNIAAEATKKGIETINRFFDKETLDILLNQGKQADLIVANNIIAQVPDILFLFGGMKSLLKPSGIITMEFHYLKNLIEKNQFDTISHERFYYLSFSIVEKMLQTHGLTVFDVEQVPTHGGSLRVYACHTENYTISKTNRPQEIRSNEREAGLEDINTYLSFCNKVEETKLNLLKEVTRIKRKGKSIIGYGAHAEAHTFLNYCNIKTGLLDYLADRNPSKQGKFLAGVHLPILNPDKIQETKPDYILILPWSIKFELMNQLSYIAKWDGRFLVAIPKLEIYDSNGKQLEDEISKE